MIRRLRFRFVCINMTIVTIMLSVIFGLTLHLTRENMGERSLEQLYHTTVGLREEERQKKDKKPDTATNVTTNTVGGGVSDADSKPFPPDRHEETPGGDRKVPGQVVTFTLWRDSSGTLQATGSDSFDLTDTDYLEEIYQAALAINQESNFLQNYNLRFLRIHGPDSPHFIFMDVSKDVRTFAHLIRDCSIISIIAFSTFLLISIFLSFIVIRPVEKAWKQQRQFVADASHELKTPLTVIMTNAEMLKDPSLSPEARSSSISNVLDMSRRMRLLTEEMLNLARADNARTEALTELCDLSQLLEDSVLSFEPLFYEQSLSLEASLEKSLQVKGNETQLRQLADILLDNAQKYSLPGSTQLRLKKQGMRHCILTLSNPANPVSREELAHLFERFYRVDTARTSSDSYGLGLSIAEAIVSRHHGSIFADWKDGILTFTVRLPLAG